MDNSNDEKQSYFLHRMALLGITPEINKVQLWHSEWVEGENNIRENKAMLKSVPIFKPHEKGIEIIVYGLDRNTINYKSDESRWKKGWSIIRLEKPFVKPDGQSMKYQMPKGQGSYPFFPPALLDKYDAKEVIPTLYITEGFFKAFKGSMHGINIIGLASITHMKDKQKGTLHPDIIALIKQCKVSRVVWLTDGDCLDISTVLKNADGKEKDLYTRPNNFFVSITTFKQLLDDYDADKYFIHINIDDIIGNNLFSQVNKSGALETHGKLTRNDVKGLDDLLCAFPDKINDIVADLNSVSKPGEWFLKFNITSGTSKVRKHFRLDNVTDFYHFHADRRQDFKNKEFIFHGTRYRFNEEKCECDVIIPGAAKDYFRVGNVYYKYIQVPNKYKQLERKFEVRLKSTIIDDHGREFSKHIPKYESFCNVPDHVSYHQVINSCFNVYNPLDFLPDEDECTLEDCSTIVNYLKHIFGENKIHFKHPKTLAKSEYRTWELALDYIQILYQKPWQMLPILCLVSRENNTGKSTLGKLFKQIFGGNCAIVGNQDLAGDFNAHWSTKLMVICDETKIDKQHVVEKVKSLSTADKIMMNAKGKDQVEIDCFIKFMFITNNEESFISVTDEDIRYWVIKVPVIKDEIPNLLDFMIEEIPAFLSFLNRRKLMTEKLNRMWFYPSLIRTDALRKVVEFSRPQIVKEIRSKIRDLFFETGQAVILMTKTAILEDLLGRQRYEDFYLEKVLKEHMKLEQYHIFEFNDQKFKTEELAIQAVKSDAKLNITTDFEALHHVVKKTVVHRHQYPKIEKTLDQQSRATERKVVFVSDNGRPYMFYRTDFLTQDEIQNNLPNQEISNMVGDEKKIPDSVDELPF